MRQATRSSGVRWCIVSAALLLAAGCGVGSPGSERSDASTARAPQVSAVDADEVAGQLPYDVGGDLRIAALSAYPSDPIPAQVWESLRPDGSTSPVRSQRVASLKGADFYLALSGSGLLCVIASIPSQSTVDNEVGGSGCTPVPVAFSGGIYLYSGDLDLAAIVVPDGYSVRTLNGHLEMPAPNLAIVSGDGARVMMTKNGASGADATSQSFTVTIPAAHLPDEPARIITQGSR